MFVDASVIIAILTREPQADACERALQAGKAGRNVTNVLAVWEAAAALLRKKQMPILAANSVISDFLEAGDIEVLSIDEHHRLAAMVAFEAYGRHAYGGVDRNRALNMADCFHYAVARGEGVPMLSLDAGFALTDISVVEIG
ncbi:type II toxin-antitoxin system VapC family toxin [Rhizobium sp. TRM95111]|uniref:type II toxin-antitoxin system VapC family toxin n=1 Tax=Rhizobium alarense TaxID=2846851 RepID=UPI001F3E9D68|nr:type II toxin-antitoxin system VapC family toxin [Rhizobium alarense]MCF3641565.1 type II toxin-antitoxin system VapC family toxin [Rhizobium alarense]